MGIISEKYDTNNDKLGKNILKKYVLEIQNKHENFVTNPKIESMLLRAMQEYRKEKK